jgi:predicted MFS family arabinose efflux permease
VTAGLSALVYGIVSTDTHPWGSPSTVTALTVGTLLVASFIVIEARIAARPLMPLAIFRLRSLSVGNAVAVTVGAALFGMYFFLSLYLQQINGYSPLRAGLAFLPSGLAVFGGALSASRLVVRIGARRQLGMGLLVAAAGLFWLSQVSPGSGYAAYVLGPALLVGVGFGLSFVPMTMAAMADVAPHDAGLASGILNTSRQIGGAIGLAVLAALASGASRLHASGRAALDAALTTGYDRAFAVSALILMVGAALAQLLPSPAALAPAGDGGEVELLSAEA